MGRDCISTFKQYILDSSYADEDTLEELDEKCQESIRKSVEFADDSPFPDSKELTQDVYTSYG